MRLHPLAWLEQLARAFRRGLTRRGRTPRRRCTLALEALEQRAVPAVYQVTTTADGPGVPTPSVTPGVNFDVATLRGAIIGANANLGADTINLPGGTYNLTVKDTGGPEDTAASGDLDITDNLTLQHVGSGSTVIDATGLGDRVFKILAPPAGVAPTVAMFGLTIQNGQAPVGDSGLGGSNDAFGGGILNEGSLTLTDCVVQQNVAQGTSPGNGSGGNGIGGGIFTAGPMLTLLRTRVLNNHAQGGISTDSLGGTGVGGGIADPPFNPDNSPFTGTIALTDSTVSDNLAQGGDAPGDYGGDGIGGGLSTEGGTATITSSTVARNQAVGGNKGVGQGLSDGGGINNLAGLTLTNSTVSSNQASDDGGGIAEAIPQSVTLRNSTITANVADSNADGSGDGGGVWSNGTLTVRSTIIAGNFDNTPAPGTVNPDITINVIVGTTVTSQGNNLIGDPTGSIGFTNGVNHDQVGVLNAGLLPLGFYGGLTETHALQLFSPAIDKGSNLDNLPFDQRESPFLRTVGPQTDVGAYEVQDGKLSGTVYRDNNNNGLFESGLGETGIGSVTVTLTGTDFLNVPVSLTAITGPNGIYTFPDVRPSNSEGYTLTETQPAGFLAGKDAVGTVNGVSTGNLANPYVDTVTGIVVGDGGSGVGYNFGELVPASLSGFVYRDDNDNGDFEPGLGEVGIPGAIVTLTGTDDRGANINQPAITAVGGAFTFTGLRPGTYTLTETQPGGFLDGKDTQGTPGNGTPSNDQFANVTLAAGVNGANNNFGELLPASLSGFVYRDDNDNGDFEPGLGEVGIPGAIVILTGTDDLGAKVSQATATDSGGAYNFGNLRPGTYTLTQSQPAGFLDGKDTQGTPGNGTTTTDQFANIALAAGVNGANNNFGELLPPPPPSPPPATAQLSGLVFRDDNGDGQFEPQLGEVGLANVLVSIKAVGDPSTLTAADGSFVFTGLPAGTYVLTVTPPPGVVPGTPTPGSAGGIPVNNGQITGIALTAGTVATGYLFAELPPVLPSFADAVVTPSVVAAAVSPTLLGKVELLGSSVISGSTGSLQSYANYVNGLYNDVLGRAASTAGVNFWVSRLLGGESRPQVAADFWTSPEHRGLQVDRFFQHYLHRYESAAGRDFWVNVFLSGASETDVAVAFLTSPEYLADQGSGVNAFVASVYRDVLGRPLDQAGQNYWVGGVQAGRFTFADVARQILNSDEAAFDLIGLYYARYLRRALDVAGAQLWLAELRRDQSPTLAAALLLGTDEYYSLPH